MLTWRVFVYNLSPQGVADRLLVLADELAGGTSAAQRARSTTVGLFDVLDGTYSLLIHGRDIERISTDGPGDLLVRIVATGGRVVVFSAVGAKQRLEMVEALSAVVASENAPAVGCQRIFVVQFLSIAAALDAAPRNRASSLDSHRLSVPEPLSMAEAILDASRFSIRSSDRPDSLILQSTAYCDIVDISVDEKDAAHIRLRSATAVFEFLVPADSWHELLMLLVGRRLLLADIAPVASGDNGLLVPAADSRPATARPDPSEVLTGSPTPAVVPASEPRPRLSPYTQRVPGQDAVSAGTSAATAVIEPGNAISGGPPVEQGFSAVASPETKAAPARMQEQFFGAPVPEAAVGDSAAIAQTLVSNHWRMLKHIRSGLNHRKGTASKPPHLRTFGCAEDATVFWGSDGYRHKIRAAAVGAGAACIHMFNGMTPDQMRWSFRIEGNAGEEPLYLVAQSDDMFRVWVEGLAFLIDHRRTSTGSSRAAPEDKPPDEMAVPAVAGVATVASSGGRPAAQRRVPAGSI